MKILSSKEIKSRNIKFFWYGDTGTRKTETILRNFPKVLLIDTEGNADMCVDMPEIPEFLLAQTKDANEILNIIDQVAAGKIKFPDGSPVITLGIDSATPLWDIGKDVAAGLAETRAKKKGWANADAATPVMLDWSVSKRPIKRIYTRLNNCPIPFIIFTGREKPLYEDLGNNNLKKIGVTYDAMGGIEYEVNVALHFMKDPKTNAWSFESVKTQGSLGKLFPEGKVFKEFPIKEVLEYADKLQATVGSEEDSDEIVQRQVEQAEGPKRDLNGLKAEAKKLGIVPDQVGPILKEAGFSGFKPSDWEAMVAALEAAAPEKGNGSN